MTELELTPDEELLLLAHRWLATVSDRVWPGWDAAGTPVAVYSPQARVVLAAHPSPPPEFQPAETALGPAWLFPGDHPLVRACTASEIGGVQTACLLSEFAGPSGWTLPSLLGLVAHEAFHCFQFSAGFSPELPMRDLTEYPTEDPTNVALAGIEDALLADAGVPDQGLAKVRDSAAVRAHRLTRLEPRFAAVEEALEKLEGTAHYAELRVAAGLRTGALDLSSELVESARRHGLSRRGSVEEQAADYLAHSVDYPRACPVRSPSGLWGRSRAVGGLKGLWLDELRPAWKVEVAAAAGPGALLAAATAGEAKGTDAAAADVARILDEYDFAGRKRAEEALLEAKRRERAELLARFDAAARPMVIVDLPPAAERPADDPQLTRQFDPENLVTFPGGRMIHTRIFAYRRPGFALDSHAVPPLPVLEDPSADRMVFPLPAGMALRDGQVGVDYLVGGLRLSYPGCRVTREGPSFRLIPAAAISRTRSRKAATSASSLRP